MDNQTTLTRKAHQILTHCDCELYSRYDISDI